MARSLLDLIKHPQSRANHWNSPFMRLQCPNCDAEYEVDAAAIPHEGRDVQCSNCGHGWYQAHPDYGPDPDLESALYDPPPPLPQAAPFEGGFPKREIDPAALQILREEAALEEAKRAAELKAADQKAADQKLAADRRAALETAQNAAAQSGAQTAAQSGPQTAPDIAPDISDTEFADIEAALDADRDQALPMPQIETGDASAISAAAPRVIPRRVARLKGLGEDGAVLAPQIAPQSAAPPVPARPQPAAPNAQPVKAAPNARFDDAAPFDAPAHDHSSAEGDLRGEIGAAKPARKGGRQTDGRRAGFYTAILAAVAGVAGYVAGPDLAARVPALAGPLAEYVGVINSLRDQIETFVPQVQDLAIGAIQSVRGWLTAQGWL